MRSSITRVTSAFTVMLLALAGLVFTSTPAQAAIVLNANGVTLNFNETTQTRDIIAGGGTSSTMGTTQGSKVRYRNVATIASIVVDAEVETLTVSAGTTINKFDGGSALGSQPGFFQSNVTTSGAGYVIYKFAFVVGGSSVNAGQAVTLQNVYINSYDIDTSGDGSNQYTHFSGVQSYTLSTNTTLNVNSSGNLLQFTNNNLANTSNYGLSDGSYTKGRVQVKYDNLSTINIKVGNDNLSTGGLSYFALDFSIGLPWTEGSSTTYQGASVVNSYNSPPTSTSDSKTVSSQVATAITGSDFGAYADIDLNPWVSVKVVSLPAGGTLRYFSNSQWQTVTAGQVLDINAIDANLLEYTSNSPTVSDQFTFKVGDGLADSVSAYTLALTVTGSSAPALLTQVITFAQPANQLLPSATLVVAPTADSGLTVALDSLTPFVCSVSGFTISFLTIGTCTLSASQPGDSTYAPATNVSRSFEITSPQVITFNQPIDRLLTEGGVTLSPSADSGLLVDLASSNPSVCIVGGFYITFVADGTCSLTASQLGNSQYSRATDVVKTFLISSPPVNTQVQLPPATIELPRITPPAQPDIDPIDGKTNGTTPITLPVPTNRGTAGSSCLIDPADLICKQTVTIPGKGTFVLDADGKTTFQAAPGFYGTLTVQYRVTDGFGRFDTSPVTVEVLNPNPSTPNNETPATTQSGTTKGTTPVVLTPEKAAPAGAEICLVDPTDNVCKTVVKLPGVGTWTQSPNGSVKFVAVTGYIGSNTIMQRVTRASFKGFSPFTVSVAKTRGPVTITISGFADGSPALTAAIRAKIDAFLRAHADYKNVYCIGYTEGPTVLKTDAALSKARAVNGCAYVKSGLGKKLTLSKLTSGQGTVEAAKFRRITITLTD